ncbi:MAG: peptidase M48 [Comamonadaceae bacterium PBBC1]|nr:MAG: peptidase M48 [Comamonadaceae bacterium PBBC1]
MLASLACAVTFAPVRAQTLGLPALGDGESISLSAERQLGDRIARELYRDPDFLEDAVLDEYIQQLWAPLIKSAAARGDLSPELQERFAWRILLGRDRTVNAFALPGGYLGVHLGLIAVVSSHDELASVLAHELSHVTQRHIARSMDDQAKMTPWVIGSMILGALAASKSAQGAQALIVGGQAAAAQSQLSYSRDMEREADRVGYGILVDAGYDPKGFVGMFAKLQQASGLNDSGAFPYLRSHPLTTERLADMQARQQLNASAAAAPSDVAQAMLAARARVLAQSSPDALRAWTQDERQAGAGRSEVQQIGALYAATLAYLQMRNMEGADRTLASLTDRLAKVQADKGGQGLLQAAPEMAASRWLRLLRAEVAFKQNRFEAVLTTLVPNGPQANLPRPELIAVAQALQRLPQHPWLDGVTRQLRSTVQRSPNDAQAWQTLAGLLSLQGAALGALRAEGEAQIARLDWTGAVDRLRAAQDRARQGRLQPGDHIEASIVDARLRYAQDRLRDMQVQRN